MFLAGVVYDDDDLFCKYTWRVFYYYYIIIWKSGEKSKVELLLFLLFLLFLLSKKNGNNYSVSFKLYNKIR